VNNLSTLRHDIRRRWWLA